MKDNYFIYDACFGSFNEMVIGKPLKGRRILIGANDNSYESVITNPLENLELLFRKGIKSYVRAETENLVYYFTVKPSLNVISCELTTTFEGKKALARVKDFSLIEKVCEDVYHYYGETKRNKIEDIIILMNL